MPTFTAIALDRLLEPGYDRAKSNTDSTHVNNIKDVTVRSKKLNGPVKEKSTENAVQKKHHWTQISPALYTTPEATPIPDAPSSFPPSPYIINHKRRGASLARRSLKEARNEESRVQITHVGSVDVKNEISTVEKDVPDADNLLAFNEIADEFVDDEKEGAQVFNEVVYQSDPHSIMMHGTTRDEESDNFFDPRDSLSCSSYSDGDDSPGLESSVKFASIGEFYDATEELSSDSGTSQPLKAPPRDFESELREMKLALLVEIERRKQAEDDLQHLRCQWLKLREQLSSVGISLPADFPFYPETDPGNGSDVSEQINIARFVSEAVGRGVAKAEAEKEMEEQLKLKNFEISRLNDRLNYYEAVNHEMSQRNQEVMGSARRLRQQRSIRKRWVWGSVATAITLGTAALAWSYLPVDKGKFFSNYQEMPKESDNSGN